MSYWDFSDVFEEQGVTRTPFYGGFGLIASDEIPKPALHAFAMLHKLGERRIALDSDSALATRRADGTVVLALWNYAAPYGEGATYTPPPAVLPPAKSFTVKVDGVRADARVTVWRLDADHGNVLKAYDAMGRPADPSREQIAALRAAGESSAPEQASLRNGSFSVRIPAQGLVVVSVAK
jgi:xylan 1,4-beta-xylosidase